MARIGSAGAVIQNEKGEFLLQLRENKEGIFYPGMWGFFGGGIKEGEKPKEAAIRELKEELGVDLLPKDLKFLLRHGRKNSYVYYIRWDKKLSDLKLMEGEDMKYFIKKEILKLKNGIPSQKTLIRILPLLKFFRKS